LTTFLNGHSFSICNVTHPKAKGSLLAISPPVRWTFHTSYNPDEGETPDSFTPDRCCELIRTAVGTTELSIEILSILPWEAAAGVADKYQVGRVFLAGDAAHVMPPTGGYGGNTGIQDAHNLAWKLAMVYHHKVDPAILTTYERERLPIAHQTMEQSEYIANSGLFQALFKGTESKGKIVNVVLGYKYNLVNSDDSQETVGNARTGTRAPHVWLKRNGEKISTIDLFKRQFVLLVSGQGDYWRGVVEVVSNRYPIVMYTIGQQEGDLIDTDNEWSKEYEVTTGGAILVRPDGFVAWRSREGQEHSENELIAAMTHYVKLET